MNIQPKLTELAKQLLDQDQDIAFGFNSVAGEFAVISFGADDTINAPYSFEVEFASFDGQVDLHALMDTEATLGIYNRFQEPRFFHGVITDITRGLSGTHRTFYRAVLRPKLARLVHSSDARIWQQKSVPEIVKEVLTENGVNNVEWRLAGQYEVREYLTQFSETHLGFIERILAEEGIFYYFEHSADEHKLIFTDAPFSTGEISGTPVLEYKFVSGGVGKGPIVSAFELSERLRSSTYELNDYTFHNPNARMNERTSQTELNGNKGKYELYAYPGRYKNSGKVGKEFVRNRLESQRVDATTGSGRTNSVHMAAGYHFELFNHDYAPANGSHFILSVTHGGTQPAALEEEAGGGATTYQAEFVTMPASLPYRPPVMVKPLIDGPQIAIVTGPAGEEIYTDEHGRVKVHFPWDRHNAKDENSSCWIRVSQNWAGGSWGHVAIPRIGQEVIVDYLDGDPDQPIIVGRTYHAVNKPPYPLPANKTVMSIKSQTHKGEGYNELRFEDEAGREEVWMHAQKDHNTVIENDETHQIVHDRSKSVGNDQSESVGHDKSISVGNDHSESIGNNATVSVGVNRSTSIGQDQRLNVGRDHFTDIGQNQIDNFGKDYIQNVGNIMRHAVYGDHQYEIGGHFQGQVNGDYKLDAGSSITNNTGHHKLMAYEKFEISGPGGSIIIDSSGITLKAPVVNIKAMVRVSGSGSGQVNTLGLSANNSQPLAEECPKAQED